MEVHKATEEEIKEMEQLSIWEKEVSSFPWEYSDKETCLIISGAAEVVAEDGSKISFGVEDLVTFEQGLKCTWNITKPIKKYYKFG